MLGRVGAFLLLAIIAIPLSPVPTVAEADFDAFDAQLRTFGYDGISRQERALVLTQAEVFDKYYLALEAAEITGTSAIPGPVGDGPYSGAAAYVQVKRFGTSDVICEGSVHDLDGSRKYQICNGLKPETHYVVVYVNTLHADVHLFGMNNWS